MNYAKNWVMAFIMYADDHNGMFPTNYDNATNYLKDNEVLSLATNQFEIVYHGAQNAITNSSSTVVLREIADPGATLKVYGFADGHTEVHKAGDGNFQPWESQHIIPPDAQ